MSDINIKTINNVHIKISCESSIAQELNEHFSFEAPGARFHPLVRSKMWDGKIRLYHLMSGYIHTGLKKYVEHFAEVNNYTVDTSEYVDTSECLTKAEVNQFCDHINVSLPNNGKIYDYQKDAVYQAINTGRRLLISPTGSGKSLIIYTLMRWHHYNNRKQLILVPTTSLVEQLYSDFESYSQSNGWDVSKYCSKIYSGFEKTCKTDITISTWQSIYKLPAKFFNQFEVMFGDEAHLFKAKSLTTIMNKGTNVPYRIGTTGTLDGKNVHKLVLEGVFGPIYQVTTTRELMDNKQLAELKIYNLLLQYADELKSKLASEKKKKDNKEKKYKCEIDFIISYEPRNKFIRNLAIAQKGNTLVLYQYVEKHGKLLYDMILSRAENRKVFFVSGSTDTIDREEIRKITELEDNAIIVASSGTFSTGINIRNLHNIIFTSPTKSRVRNLQSIGRGLRISETKTVCKLYDLSDDLTWKGKQNFTLLHMIERLKIYNEEKLDYQIVKVDI